MGRAASIYKATPNIAVFVTKPVVQGSSVWRGNAKPIVPQGRAFVLESASTSKRTHRIVERVETPVVRGNCASMGSANAAQGRLFVRELVSLQSGILPIVERAEMLVVRGSFVCRASVKAARPKPHNAAQAVVPTNSLVVITPVPIPKTVSNIAELAGKPAPQRKAVAAERASHFKTTTNTAALVGMLVLRGSAVAGRLVQIQRKIPKTAEPAGINARQEALVAVASAKTYKPTRKTVEIVGRFVVEPKFVAVVFVETTLRIPKTAEAAGVRARLGRLVVMGSV